MSVKIKKGVKNFLIPVESVQTLSLGLIEVACLLPLLHEKDQDGEFWVFKNK